MTTAPVTTETPNDHAWHSQSVAQVLAQLGSAATGLSPQEVTKRLAANGPNELKQGKRICPLQIFLRQFKSLIIWILIAAGVISGVLGEMVDAIAILAIVVLNAVIGFYQEFNANLETLGKPRTRVMMNLTSAADAVALIRSGMKVFVHGAADTLTPLLEALAARTDLEDITLTEYGAVNLYGLWLRERGQALISIAHPDFRTGLKRELAAARHFPVSQSVAAPPGHCN